MTDDAATGPTHDAVFFETLVSRLPDGVVSVDTDGRIRYANPAVEELLGYAPEDLRGRDVETLLPDRFVAAARDVATTYLAEGRRLVAWEDAELLVVDASGEEVPVSVSVVEHTRRGDRVFSAVVRDISARIDREEALVRRRNELERAATLDRTEVTVSDVVTEAWMQVGATGSLRVESDPGTVEADPVAAQRFLRSVLEAAVDDVTLTDAAHGFVLTLHDGDARLADVDARAPEAWSVGVARDGDTVVTVTA